MGIAGISLVIGCALFWMASRENLWAVFLFPLFTGIGFGATYVSFPLISGNYYGVGSFPNVMRVVNPVNCIFQYAAPTVAGMTFDISHSYGPVLLIAGIGGLIGALLIFACKPPLIDRAD
jgi:hypothetical protein